MFHDPRRMFESETSKPQNVSQTLRRFTGYFKPYWRRYLGVLVMMIASTWAAVTAPQLLGQAVDCYLVPPAATAAFEGVSPTLTVQPPSASGPAPPSGSCSPMKRLRFVSLNGFTPMAGLLPRYPPSIARL